MPKSYAEASRSGIGWLPSRASANAQNNLGVMYEMGHGVAKDPVEAVMWYRRAAEQGDTHAQHNLGNMYEGGQGVSQDYAEAVEWFRKAAERGHPMAQANLGVMYEHGPRRATGPRPSVHVVHAVGGRLSGVGSEESRYRNPQSRPDRQRHERETDHRCTEARPSVAAALMRVEWAWAGGLRPGFGATPFRAVQNDPNPRRGPFRLAPRSV